MAEGAGALVLESLEHATARGAKILGVVAGCGELADSFHRTRSSPDGKPIIGCIRNALTDAGMTAERIDYINAHGTSTPENDKMEYLGISTVFGERASAGCDDLGYRWLAEQAIQQVAAAQPAGAGQQPVRLPCSRPSFETRPRRSAG